MKDNIPETREKLTKKLNQLVHSTEQIYFSEYSPVLNAKFPKRITTLNYTYEPKLDSTTNRVLFKDLDFGKDLNIELKTFKIPTDASLVD